MDQQALIDAALEQIVIDLRDGDCTAIEELLKSVPVEVLYRFLTEGEYE